MYSKETLEHFNNPRNMGEIKNADGVGEVGNLKCGDVMRVFIKVDRRPKQAKSEKLKAKSYGDGSNKIDQKAESCQLPVSPGASRGGEASSSDRSLERSGQEEYIEDIKFQTLGCAAAIAASSMMTELAKGKTLADAEKISRDDINDSLGKLPAQKYHCSILSAEGIRKAIADYRNKKK